jgi:hypothetical protein
MEGADANDGNLESAAGNDEDRRRKRALLFESTMDCLIKWLEGEPAPATAAATNHGEPPVRVVCIAGTWSARHDAWDLYEHPLGLLRFRGIGFWPRLISGLV